MLLLDWGHILNKSKVCDKFAISSIGDGQKERKKLSLLKKKN